MVKLSLSVWRHSRGHLSRFLQTVIGLKSKLIAKIEIYFSFIAGSTFIIFLFSGNSIIEWIALITSFTWMFVMGPLIIYKLNYKSSIKKRIIGFNDKSTYDINTTDEKTKLKLLIFLKHEVVS